MMNTTTHNSNSISWILFLLVLVTVAFLHGYGINKLVLNSDELHPARAIVGDDWDLSYSPWPEEAVREYYKDWPVQFPPLFGVLSRLSVVVWQDAPGALRLWPTIFSVLAVAAAWFLFRCRLPALLAGVATLLLGVVSDKLMYYSKFFKHYTADVFLTALLVLLTLHLLKKNHWHLWLFFALTASIGLWLGFASVYVSGACFLVLLLDRLTKRDVSASSLAKFGLAALLFFISFGVLFKLTISTAVSNPIFIREWQMQIFNLEQISDLNYVVRFLGRAAFHVLLLPYYFFFDSWVIAVLANALIFVWVIQKIRNRRFDHVLITVVPLVLVILAAFLGKYPFSAGRLSLFLLPLWVWMMVEGFYYVQSAVAKRFGPAQYALSAVLVGAVFFGFYINFTRVLDLDYGGGRRVDLLYDTLSENAQDNDTVFLHWGAILPFYYYFTDHQAGFQNEYAIPGSPQDTVQIIYGEEHSLTGNYESMYQKISAVDGRLWVSFCHLWPQQDMWDLVEFLNSWRGRPREYEFKGCKLLLYEAQPTVSTPTEH